MTFSIRNYCHPLKNIFTIAILEQSSRIKNSRLRCKRAGMLMCCLLHFKFFCQIINNFLMFSSKIRPKVIKNIKSRAGSCCPTKRSIILIKFFTISTRTAFHRSYFINIFKNSFIINNKMI